MCQSFSYPFHCWYYNPVAIFSLCLLAHAYHVEFKLVKFLDVTVLFLMYMEKLVCSNGDSNKETIREQ